MRLVVGGTERCSLSLATSADVDCQFSEPLVAFIVERDSLSFKLWPRMSSLRGSARVAERVNLTLQRLAVLRQPVAETLTG